ncbi:MAG: hypothetical protein A3G75_16295 [Verrucomicrobia bacterium RIFCSPLOWO2_12_FULL_64_8]|nr:MAG: hypothetical protein A3G75_16295 [Verrucomicrobia bacterium RIFCSPLOWO2_12_FULL_64_8]
MSELERVTDLCLHLGAVDRAQAETMARQLLKRADQLAAERGIPRVEAMDYLLRLVQKGRAGEVDPEFAARPPARPAEK